MAKTVSIDVIDKSIPSDNTRNIPIINQPNPCKGYAATTKEVAQLIKLASYYVYAAGTISVDGKPVCSVVNDGTITAGIGNVIRVPKGTTINYTLKSNGIQTASVSVFNCI